VLDDKADTGWAISPMPGRSQTATFIPRTVLVTPEGSTTALTFTLEFEAPKLPGFSLGRFRLWALGAADPATAASIPADVQEILKVPADKRNEEQNEDLAAYYRSIAPSLEPTRQRLAELKRQLPSLPVVVARNKSATVPIPIFRSPDFAAPVQVTLEGFSAGRDPATRMPAPITKNFQVTALTVAPEGAVGKLSFKPNGNCELGTRMVVVKAESKIGNDTYVQYSPAFPVTVVEK
jgi:hypothetical protein